MSVELLCRRSATMMGAKAPRSPLTPSPAITANNVSSKRWATVEDSPATKLEGSEEEHEGVFSVGLMVAAVGEGKILTDGSRKTREVLENISRFVSKEQNTTAVVGGQGKAIEIKMRVFVQNSIEARAVTEYMAEHPNQKPSAFVLLVESLDMAVLYPSSDLDPSSAAVADRLRKQAKTRAVRLVREAIACPESSITEKMIRGYDGPLGPVPRLKPFVSSRSLPMAGALSGHTCISFHAKSRPQEGSRPASKGLPPTSAHSNALQNSVSNALGQHQARQVSSSSSSAFGDAGTKLLQSSHASIFPVSLFVTAIADGTLARDTPQKARERLGQIISKIPKEQNTSVDLKEGIQDLKMRVFVAGSEDAKAVSEYIQTHSGQIPAPFVILARDLPMALLFDTDSLDLTDASVADRLRKQAKTRAVKLIREVIGEGARTMGARVLRGHSGATAVSDLLAPLIAAKAKPVPGQPGSRRYIAFAARTKAGPSPYTSPSFMATPAPPSPPLHSLDVDEDEKLCIKALRALARHSNSENADNGVSRRILPGPSLGSRWWQYVDRVSTSDCCAGELRSEEESSRGLKSDGADEDEDSAREGSAVHIANHGFSDGSTGRCQGGRSSSCRTAGHRVGGNASVAAGDHVTTLWHICKECSAEKRVHEGKSPTLGIHAAVPAMLPPLTLNAPHPAAQASASVTKRPREVDLTPHEESKAAKSNSSG